MFGIVAGLLAASTSLAAAQLAEVTCLDLVENISDVYLSDPNCLAGDQLDCVKALALVLPAGAALDTCLYADASSYPNLPPTDILSSLLSSQDVAVSSRTLQQVVPPPSIADDLAIEPSVAPEPLELYNPLSPPETVDGPISSQLSPAEGPSGAFPPGYGPPDSYYPPYLYYPPGDGYGPGGSPAPEASPPPFIPKLIRKAQKEPECRSLETLNQPVYINPFVTILREFPSEFRDLLKDNTTVATVLVLSQKEVYDVVQALFSSTELVNEQARDRLENLLKIHVLPDVTVADKDITEKEKTYETLLTRVPEADRTLCDKPLTDDETQVTLFRRDGQTFAKLGDVESPIFANPEDAIHSDLRLTSGDDKLPDSCSLKVYYLKDVVLAPCPGKFQPKDTANDTANDNSVTDASGAETPLTSNEEVQAPTDDSESWGWILGATWVAAALLVVAAWLVE